jgi:hypothetical protein
MWITILNVLQGFGWVGLGCFSLHCLWLLGLWARHHRQSARLAREFDQLPVVTVQLPEFNERYVVGRLLAAVARLDYPKDRLEIHVLDDSIDDTTDLIAQRIMALHAQGYRVRHVHRSHRSGFKAGALAEGFALAQGEFLALFDADFVPPPDFLRRTIHHFTDPTVGMVQTRWGHLNRFDSLLTRAQALMLDGHFLIEQVARSRSGAFFNFNGSAGVWRKQAVLDAGGWQPDTLTEDLDLSYRAQLKGWRFLYVSDVVVPAELPVEMSSLKAQHHRWALGSIQTALKLLPQVLRSSQPWHVKLETCFHFGMWLHYPLGILVALLILPELMIHRSQLGVQGEGVWGGFVGPLLLTTTAIFHGVAQRQVGSPWRRIVSEVPVLMAVTVGLALNNTRAIWEALRGSPASFHRTPKYNGRDVSTTHPGYRSHPGGARWWWAEVALGVYVCAALGYAASQAFYAIVPFLLPLSAGFLYGGLSSLSLRAGSSAQPAVASLESVVARVGKVG